MFKEALQIRRELVRINSTVHMPDLATILSNYANLLSAIGEFDEALEKYNEALKIRRNLAIENPDVYLPNVAITLGNLSSYYLKSIPNKEKSILLANEAIDILTPLSLKNPYLNKYINGAKQILRSNGVLIK